MADLNARRIDTDYPDLNLCDDVRIYGPDGQVVYDGTATASHERVLGPGTGHAHIENPDRPGWSLCLVKLAGTRTHGGDCRICADLALENRTWIAR